MNAISLFGHVAYMLTLFSYMVRDMLKLRVLAIIAGCFAVVYSLFYTTTVLWVEFSWESAMIVVNTFHVIKILRERGNMFFTREEIALHKKFFSLMAKHEFKSLLAAGGWRSVRVGEELIREGKRVDFLSVITKGRAAILADGITVAHCGAGSLLGEMSYLTGERASATVRAVERMRCFEWNQSELKKVSAKNEAVNQGMQGILNQSFVKKLKSRRKKKRVATKNKRSRAILFSKTV